MSGADQFVLNRVVMEYHPVTDASQIGTPYAPSGFSVLT